MAFPLSPVNGQSSVLNGLTYAYNSTKGAWIRVAGTVTATAVLSVTSTASSTSTTTGAWTRIATPNSTTSPSAPGGAFTVLTGSYMTLTPINSITGTWA